MAEQQAVYDVSGMHCAGCSANVERAIESVAGVASVRVNLVAEKAYVRTENGDVDFEVLSEAVRRAGYELKKPSAEKAERRRQLLEEDERKMSVARGRMLLAWGLSVPIIAWMIPEMILGVMWPSATAYHLGMVLLALPVLAGAGRPTYRSAWRSALNRTPNMDVLIALGSGTSLLTGVAALAGAWLPIPRVLDYAGVGAMIMAFHLTGRFVETRARGRASLAIKKLLTLEARTARIQTPQGEKEIGAEEVEVGDIMIVRPGEKVPTDGQIIEGSSDLDESLATGESMPVSRGPGEEVIGATVNGGGALKVRATSVGEDTFLAQIIRMVEEAQGSEVPIQLFADRVTSIFVPVVLGVALLTLGIWLFFPAAMHSVAVWAGGFLPWVDPGLGTVSLALFAAIAVLVIACPCALGLATPTALMVGSGMGAENGVLIRRGEAIQRMKDVDVILLDKTGTITAGRPAVTDILAAPGGPGVEELLGLAAGAELDSEHPIARAIRAAARDRGIPIPASSRTTALPGLGIRSVVEGTDVLIGTPRLMEAERLDTGELGAVLAELESKARTAFMVAARGRVLGVIAVADPIKEDSAAAVEELRSLGLEPVMVTGDNELTARAIAVQVGIERVLSGVLPGDKSGEVRRLQEAGRVVAMVGDGINDAPALAQADVGIAVGTGTDVAIESADITLVRGELTSVIKAVRLSRATFRKIRQNLFWAYFYNIVAVPLAILGMLHPMIAEAAMAFSSVNVVTNSARLKRQSIAPSYATGTGGAAARKGGSDGSPS